ncbi:NUDIX hydrolase [Planctomicrobium piriforme]|uniref:16S rRNA (Adenine1518-N6/adenine1519-N6)-dimethyltransferase n=1 Tax=Planctomicrobium piriforme TaxID=1576369 RepID=A0A1I3HCR0_9PLAN|nr:NUDIX domain-containing protein [Planctomicrobium piriforme]SFI33442.1 16S rRNA (adenine1518-N6/adenine1519-N6)-dimethyltransferase [Planctomicrobium piriforme]
MAEEIFDVCDEQDQVIGQAPRSEVHARDLLHRAVHIWIWNSRGELLIHRRSEWKDQYPKHFTSSSSGHVDAGESYETAAHRELFEELQLKGTLEYMTKLPGGAETAFEHTVLYFLKTDATPTPDPAEIAELHYLTPSVVHSMVKSQPGEFTPPFLALFRWWAAHSGLK